MLKLKSVVTAAMLLVAGGAMASNFRAADQVYLPAAGHAVGGGSLFISDVFISNLSTTDSVQVSVIFNSGPTGTPQTFNNVITLAPNERREILDFFPTVLGLQSGLGQLIFNACKMGGNCTPSCPGVDVNGNCPDFRNISVESRIYSVAASSPNPTSAPSNGQLFSGIPWYNFVSASASAVGLDKVFITGLRNTAAYRSNVGLVNASQYSSTTLVVKLFDGKTNAQIGSTYTEALSPLGQAQRSIGSIFPGFTGATATNAYLTVEQTNTTATGDAAANGCPDGCPAFLAYGSQLDNQTNDATTLEPQFLQPLNQNAIFCIFNQSCKGTFTIKHAVRHQ